MLKTGSRSLTGRTHEGYRYVLPGLAVLFLIAVIPLIMMVYLSMTSFEMGEAWDKREFVALENYSWLFSGQDYKFYPSAILTLKYISVVISASLAIGMVIALLLNQNLKFRTLVMAFLLAPIVTSTPVVGLSWRLMFHMQNGIINHLLQQLNLPPVNWLGKRWAFTAVVIATLWRSGAFMGLVLTAGIQTIPRELYEAASVGGATALERFTYVTLPLLKPIILIALLLQSIASMQQFGLVHILTGGGPGGATELLSLHLHKQALAYNGFVGKGAAIAVVLTTMSVALSTILIATTGSREEKG